MFVHLPRVNSSSALNTSEEIYLFSFTITNARCVPGSVEEQPQPKTSTPVRSNRPGLAAVLVVVAAAEAVAAPRGWLFFPSFHEKYLIILFYTA